KASINPRLLSRRRELHQHEENNQVQDEKAVGNRNKSTPRHPRDDGGEDRVCEDHRDENNGEHPPQVFEISGTDVIANWPDHIVTSENDEKENETEPERADFLRFYVNDVAKEFSHSVAAALRAARTRRTATRLQFFLPGGKHLCFAFGRKTGAQFRFPVSRFSTIRIVHSARSQASMNCTGS